VIGLGVSSEAREAYAGWRIGLLELGGLLPRGGGAALEAEVERVEAGLRASCGGIGRRDLARLEPLRPYAEHFSRSGRAYPVLLQAEAIASKGRRIEMPDPLVRAMFAAELESMLLTAGHDLGAMQGPITLGVAAGTESMPTLGGAEKRPPPGDLVMRDAEGIVASVLLGPDARTSIGPASASLLFVVYAPPEVREAGLRAHLERLAALAALACPGLSAGEAELTRL
jgi:hypothetical protein